MTNTWSTGLTARICAHANELACWGASEGALHHNRGQLQGMGGRVRGAGFGSDGGIWHEPQLNWRRYLLVAQQKSLLKHSRLGSAPFTIDSSNVHEIRNLRRWGDACRAPVAVAIGSCDRHSVVIIIS